LTLKRRKAQMMLFRRREYGKTREEAGKKAEAVRVAAPSGAERAPDPVVDGLPRVRDFKPYGDAVDKLTFLEENARSAQQTAKTAREQADLAVMAATLATADLTLRPELADAPAEDEQIEDTLEARLQQAARESVMEAARRHPGEDLKKILQAEAEASERRARMAEFIVSGSVRALAAQKEVLKEARAAAERTVDAEGRRRHEKMMQRVEELWTELDLLAGQHGRLKMAVCVAKERLGEGGDGYRAASFVTSLNPPNISTNHGIWRRMAKEYGYPLGGD
jgi:hypothetical protein